MEYTFPASDIHTISSIHVAAYTTKASEIGENIVVVVPEGVACNVSVTDGILTLRGDGSSANVSGGLNLQVGYLSGGGSGGALNQMVQIKVPLHKGNLSIDNSW